MTVIDYHDLKSAFQSLDLNLVKQTVEGCPEPADTLIFQQLIDKAAFAMDDVDQGGRGEDSVQQNYKVVGGVLPGGFIAAQLFNATFWTTLEPWTDQLKIFNPTLCTESCCTEDDIYIGLSVVDDIGNRRIREPDGTLQQLVDLKQDVSKLLTTVLDKASAVLNFSK